MNMNINLKLFFDPTRKVYKRVLHSDHEIQKCFVITLDKRGKYLSGPSEYDIDQFQEEVDQKLQLQTSDPTKRFISEESISPSDRKIRDQRFGLISSIVLDRPNCYNSAWVNKKVSAILKKNDHLTRYKLHSAIRIFQASGENKNSLLPNYKNCGAKGKERHAKNSRLGRKSEYESGHELILSEKDKTLIKEAWLKFKVKKQNNTIYAAYTELISRYYRNIDRYPTITQFKYWGKKMNDPVKAKRELVGDIKFKKDFASLTGSAREMAFGPGCEAQLDSTIDDTHALSIVLENTFIGRLTFFLLIDTFSGMPMGIALVPDNASYSTTSLVIINAASDKVDFCKKLGITILPEDWPTKHLPVKILSDQGLLFGPIANSVVNNLRIQVDNCPSYRPDLKPIVERHIGKLLHKISGLLEGNGLVNKRDSPRIITDTRKEASLNYLDLLKIMVKEILYFIRYEEIEGYPLSKSMETENLHPTSLNLWNFGIENGMASLLQEDSDELRIKLLSTKPCSYNKSGIWHFKKRWICVDEAGLEVYNTIRFGGGPEKLTVSYNPIDTEEVYLSYNEQFYKLKPIQKDVHAQTFYELELLLSNKNAQNKITEHEKLAAAIEKRSFQNDVIKSAKARKRKNGGVNINMAREAKDLDRANYRATGPFSQQKIPKHETKTPAQQDSFDMPDFLSEIKTNGK